MEDRTKIREEILKTWEEGAQLLAKEFIRTYVVPEGVVPDEIKVRWKDENMHPDVCWHGEIGDILLAGDQFWGMGFIVACIRASPTPEQLEGYLMYLEGIEGAPTPLEYFISKIESANRTHEKD